MAKITINGEVFQIEGSASISINNNSISVGGNKIKDGLSDIVEIKWEGPVADVDSNASISITGDVTGDVDAGGSVKCGNVGGDVDAGGSISCGNVSGDVDAGGSISMRK